MSIAEIDRYLSPLRRKLATHPVYEAVTTPEAVRAFMEMHVAAVWDFMTLVKRLQQEMTCTSIGFVPPRDPELARFVNELVLGEESDEGPAGRPMSHLEIYLSAMEEVGADTAAITRLLDALRRGVGPDEAVARAGLPEVSTAFSTHVVRTALTGRAEEVAAHVCWGREDAIPEMFRALLDGLGPTWAPTLRFYLDRHITVDGEDHGPLARKLVERLVGEDELAWRRVAMAAEGAMRARLELWDGVLLEIQRRGSVGSAPSPSPQRLHG
jgi:hypothetical protein